MEVVALAVSPFLVLLAGSVVLLLFHVLLQGFSATQELGSAWNASPRDEEKKPSGKLAGRAARASANYQETYPAFIGLVLALAITGDSTGWGLTGAWTWIACRIVYIPLYLAGIAYVRSLIWLGSLAGLLIMASTLVF